MGAYFFNGSPEFDMVLSENVQQVLDLGPLLNEMLAGILKQQVSTLLHFHKIKNRQNNMYLYDLLLFGKEFNIFLHACLQ